LNEEIKNYIDSKFDEVNAKLDNQLVLLEKIRSNLIRALLYGQLTARQLNSFFFLDWMRNQSTTPCKPYYETMENNPKFKQAHPLTKTLAEDLTNLVVKKSKGNKEVLEDEFTQSLAFNGGIDSSLL